MDVSFRMEDEEFERRLKEIMAARLLGRPLNEEEQQWIAEWEADPELSGFMQLVSADPTLLANHLKEIRTAKIKANEAYGELLEWSTQNPARVRRLTLRITAAASVLLVAMGILVLSRHKVTNNEIQAGPGKVQQDIAPGRYRAMLTLANGQHIRLDSSSTPAVIAKQGITTIRTTASSELAYSSTGLSESQIYYNTLVTALGETYKVILPDGSTAWLNSGSSINFPTRFPGGKREISINGEVYFEVKEDAGHPFIVNTPMQSIQVLGTHFDVSAYQNDPTYTSLLEGAIRVSSGSGVQTLRTPSQAVLDTVGTLRLAADPNLEAAVAWKDNLFYFDRLPLSAIMLQLSRWYNIRVDFDNVNPARKFSAHISRSLPISRILKLLRETHEVDFAIDGNHVTVMKYRLNNK